MMGITKRSVSEIDLVVGRNLKSLRLAANISQEQVGRVLGVTFQQIQKYENGSNRIPVAMLYVLKHYYNVPFERFFLGLDKRPGQGANLPCYDELTQKICARIAAVTDTGMKRKIGKIVDILAA